MALRNESLKTEEKIKFDRLATLEGKPYDIVIIR